ncbi:unnamed protein product, partial [Meganyctiphanes norvegica]
MRSSKRKSGEFLNDGSSSFAPPSAKDRILASSKSITSEIFKIGSKVLSPTRDKDKLGKSENRNSTASLSSNSSGERPVLMTRKQLVDPFASDDEDDQPQPSQLPNDNNNSSDVEVNNEMNQNMSPRKSVLSSAEGGDGNTEGVVNDSPLEGRVNALVEQEVPGLLDLSPTRKDNQQTNTVTYRDRQSPAKKRPTSRHEELKERARHLLEQARRETQNKENKDSQRSLSKEEEERQTQLRERARRLIAEAKQGVVSPTALSSSSRANSKDKPSDSSENNSPVREVRSSPVREENGNIVTSDAVVSLQSSSPTVPPAALATQLPRMGTPEGIREVREVRAPRLQSFKNIMDRMSPDKEGTPNSPNATSPGQGGESSRYLQNELEHLEREAAQIDEQAARLEKQLRKIMELGEE